ncbi:YiaA/YiaB family inner membrane protein [Variovorax boronicumulans]|uniref:YiaA/YiaB family inner membrane protein n=1 Tax=Variovorax boronicumulans TaxID=436515 RepID=UPI003398B0BD
MQPFSSTTVSIQRDTRAWQLQAWASFAVAVFLCATGLSWLPGEALDRAFMVMGYVFCLSTVFMLSKFVRDAQQAQHADASGGGASRDLPMWRLVVWGSFFIAMGLTGWGLVRMDINDAYKAFLGVSWLFLISAAFTLAKMLRDRHEADLIEARLQGRRAARQEAAASASAE